MTDAAGLAQETVLALSRVAAEGAAASGPEEALWAITRTLPAILGDRAAALSPRAFRDEEPPAVTTACAVFLRMPDNAHHLIAAPVNFPPEQHHELVDIGLGHPGHVANTRRPMVLHDTTLHAQFVKILQAFRAGSSMFTPMLWQDESIGVIICANAARGTFRERDLAMQTAFAGLASALFMAHGGPAWLAGIDTSRLPVRRQGN
ncbi:GAF domain-containing protein [Sabulicella rubraurantiaca]|uniref:GAF domain-containing protein n=1 Tax=Sabulicella rubraurantiaca TaxID=2811429 RepID=UPI0022A8C548|nr:GAF domain-containing protein [Sabulicella rubraurantiaca]